MDSIKIYESVIYTGETKFAYDDVTIRLMERFLTPGNKYIYKCIVDYIGNGSLHYCIIC